MSRLSGAADVDRPVAAVITDILDAVDVARRAVTLAGEHRLLVLLVPLPRVGVTIDAAVVASAQHRRGQEAAAIVARVTPTLADHPRRHLPVPELQRSAPSARRLAPRSGPRAPRPTPLPQSSPSDVPQETR